MNISYIEILSIKYPSIVYYCVGNGSDYNSIILVSGGPLPTQETLDADILDEIKTRMWELIKTERDRRTKTGGYKVGANWFHSDDSSRIQQLALVMMGASIPPNLYWKTLSGSFVVMTQTLAGQIFGAAAMSDQTIFGVAEQKRQDMIASQDPGNYDYLTGWPLIYGE